MLNEEKERNPVVPVQTSFPLWYSIVPVIHRRCSEAVQFGFFRFKKMRGKKRRKRRKTTELLRTSCGLSTVNDGADKSDGSGGAETAGPCWSPLELHQPALPVLTPRKLTLTSVKHQKHTLYSLTVISDNTVLHICRLNSPGHSKIHRQLLGVFSSHG